MARPDASPSRCRLRIVSSSNCIEYRYYLDKGKAKQDENDLGFLDHYVWLDALFIGISSYLWFWTVRSRWHLFLVAGAFVVYVYWRCSRLIYEAVIVFPPHGIQLETHRGPFRPLFVSRRFIPTVYIQDIIINEALRRWNVRYYLAVIVECPGKHVELAVAFENTLPHFPVLIEVYRGAIKALYTE